MKSKTMLTISISTMLILFFILNGMYYFSARGTIIEDQQTDIEMLLETIKTSIESTQTGEILFEKALADELRLSAIAAQNLLPKDIEEVTNEQLIDIRNKLMIEDLTLFKYLEDEDDFIGYKSSDPKQIGMKTNGWSNGLWTSIFKELMTKHNATPIPHFGENLDSFWSGPYDTATSDPTKVRKWGYYNDGTTNYLIDPYIASEKIVQFKEESGVENYIKELIEENDFIIEIAVLNDKILQGEWESYVQDDIEWHSERMVQYGEYFYSNPKDLQMAKKSFDENTQVHDITTINNREILKSYVPIELDTNVAKGFNRLILIASSDMKTIEAQVKNQTEKMIFVALIVFVVGSAIIFSLRLYINRHNKTVSDVQDMYLENIESLFKTVKEYRHDYNNQIYTITGLCGMKEYDELEKYLRNLSNIHTSFNDIININIPALSGLIQTKVAVASEHGITFEHHFERFNELQLNTRKTTDLVRIIGNIIDNAFRAVNEGNRNDKKITVIGIAKKGLLTIQIINNGPSIPLASQSKIFNRGFSSKENPENNGLGLAIVKDIVDSYKGTIEFSSNDLETSFVIKIPIANRELISNIA